MIIKIIIGIFISIIIFFAILSFITRHHVIKDASDRVLQPCPKSPNCVLSTSNIIEKMIHPFLFINNDSQLSWNTLIQTIQDQGGELLVNDGAYLHAVFTSKIFRFKDDLEATLSSDYINIRSASRAGKSDFGQNKKRIELIRSSYQTHLTP